MSTKNILGYLFAASTGYIIADISGYHLNDWHWWLYTFTIIILGTLYGNTD